MMTEPVLVFEPDSTEYKRLEAAAAFIQAETRKKCKVDITYFDHGQNWKWSTILLFDTNVFQKGIWVQILTPRWQEAICYGSPKAWLHTVQDIIQHNLAKRLTITMPMIETALCTGVIQIRPKNRTSHTVFLDDNHQFDIPANVPNRIDAIKQRLDGIPDDDLYMWYYQTINKSVAKSIPKCDF